MQKSTERSLRECRRLGYEADVVERWIPGARKRKDLFGLVDVIALPQDRGVGVLGIQACWQSDLGAHREKALANPILQLWLRLGNGYELWAWRKLKARKKDGKKGKREVWTLNREPIYAFADSVRPALKAT